jgi:myo-inositol-1(or 4)-monophosphatase
LLVNDLELITQAARAAGDIAMGFFQKDPEIWDKSDNAGPVTEADLAVDKMLSAELRAARPGYGWLSEETEDGAERLHKDQVFIVDPIDGTRAFIAGTEHWSHSIAVAKAGQIQAAAVYLPVLDMMFCACLDGGAFLNGAPISVSPRAETWGADILSAKSNFEPAFWPGGFPDLKRSFRSSLAYRLCLVANGAFDGMLTLRPTWEWDVAAGSLIVNEAGGLSTDQTGAAPLFNSAAAQLNGMVASNRDIHSGLLAGLT